MADDAGQEPRETARDGIDYLKLSNPAYLVILVFAVPVFFFFASRGEVARGFVAALSLSAVLGVAAILRPHSGQLMYWMTLLAMAVSHGLFVMLVPWPQQYHGAGIVFAPLVILDMYAWARLLLAMVRLHSA
jgi:hypothetical protein